LGKYREAAKIIRERVPLALTLGHICHHPCEAECRRGLINESISICNLKRFALEEADVSMETQEKEAREASGDGEESSGEKSRQEKASGKRVAIIGSGPAGLVAAYFLNRMGHSVTVHEEMPEAGGLLRWAIPEFRLPRHIIQREIREIEESGVNILTGSPAPGEDICRDFQDGKWDAIFLASGCQESKKIDVEGCQLGGIHWGLDFLKKVKEGTQEKLRGKILIIGGGNVAVDTAMTALRMGAEKVEMACLESREEMPAYAWEIQDAEEEKIEIHPGWGPKRFFGDNGNVNGAELQKCLSVFDEKGNFRPEFDDSHIKPLKADFIILAVGQKADLAYLPADLRGKISENGIVNANPDTLATSVRGIYAGGEVVLGPSSAVEAMATGRKAASSIDKFLGGEGLKEEVERIPYEEKGDLWMGYEENFSARERVAESKLPVPERQFNFDLIHQGFMEEEARKEASRCLRCNVRLLLSSPTLPPEKWIPLTSENISEVPDTEGAYQLLDEEKKIICIKGVPNLRQALEEQLSSDQKAKYFGYDEDPMYTKRESELIQQYLQEHGQLPSGNEEVDDLF
jgi:NADPH-dependent glutamate synthase beta subunit-like oxidoreductase